VCPPLRAHALPCQARARSVARARTQILLTGVKVSAREIAVRGKHACRDHVHAYSRRDVFARAHMPRDLGAGARVARQYLREKQMRRELSAWSLVSSPTTTVGRKNLRDDPTQFTRSLLIGVLNHTWGWGGSEREPLPRQQALLSLSLLPGTPRC